MSTELDNSETTVTLLFTPDDPCHTTITAAASGNQLYLVETDIVKRSKVTTVHGSQGGVVATLQWRDTLSDKVTIKDGKPIPLSSWLKKKPFADEMTFKDGGCEYTWVKISALRKLVLYAQGVKLPVATYAKTAEGTPGSMQTVGRLSLLPRASEIQDLVVLSLLFCEKKYFVKYASQVGAPAMAGIMLGDMLKS